MNNLANISTIITIITFLLGLILFFFNTKKLTYNFEDSDSSGKLKKKTIGLINLGIQPVKRQDIPIDDKFYLEISQKINILYIKILLSPEHTNFSLFQVIDIVDRENKLNKNYKYLILEEYKNKIYIDFDRLSSNKGAIIEIGYYNNTQEQNNISDNIILKGNLHDSKTKQKKGFLNFNLFSFLFSIILLTPLIYFTNIIVSKILPNLPLLLQISSLITISLLLSSVILIFFYLTIIHYQGSIIKFVLTIRSYKDNMRDSFEYLNTSILNYEKLVELYEKNKNIGRTKIIKTEKIFLCEDGEEIVFKIKKYYYKSQ